MEQYMYSELFKSDKYEKADYAAQFSEVQIEDLFRSIMGATGPPTEEKLILEALLAEYDVVL
jgi:hypothetical protein